MQPVEPNILAYIPPFTTGDVLPAGDYLLTVEQLRASHLVTGAGNPSAYWDATWRRQLVDNLEILVAQLWLAGVTKIFVDGCFVENKDHPNDIDGYFECDRRALLTGQLQQELNAIDPFKVWTWDMRARMPDHNSAKSQLPMWHRYRVKLCPEYGQLSGIIDEFGHNQFFPAVFRKTRAAYQPKGIVQIIR